MWDSPRTLTALAWSLTLVAVALLAWGAVAWAVRQPAFALRRVIVDYTREAGVRSLERQIGALLRNAAVTIG